MSSIAAMMPRAFTRQLLMYKMGLRLKRQGSRKLMDLPAAMESRMDAGKMRQLWLDVEAEHQKNPTSAAKYAKPREWLLLNTLRAADLGLHHQSGLRIMDIGCGPAYFLAVARALGHQVEGVDAPASYLTPVEQRVYGELIEIQELRPDVSPLLIERFVPLPFAEGRYDLITAFWICFNRHRQPDEWGAGEWRFFVEDAVRRLRPGGRLLLDLNENPERYGELRFYDQATLDYFRSAGSVDTGRVVVTR
jgi:SAM-dependent methyltransferase